MSPETTETIALWAAETFGNAGSHSRVAARANEEMAELIRAATSHQADSVIAEEAADVVIILHRLAHRCGLDLDELVSRKMQVNRGCQWKKDGTGHGYHVRDKQATR